MKAIIIRPNSMRAFNRRGRRDTQYHLPYQERGKRSAYFDKYPANQRTLINIHGYLHQYASHGTKAMYKRWKTAERRFEQRHMPYVWGRSTSRFVNEFTAHNWM